VLEWNREEVIYTSQKLSLAAQHVPSNESTRVITGCLRSTPSSFLPILSGITPSEIRCSASCLRLYTKALNPKHLLHETLHLKPSPKRLRSRKPLRSLMELLSINGEPTTPISAALQSFIPAFGPQPPGCDLPRNAWVQVNRLRTGVGRFPANMKLMDLCGSDLCECGKVETAHHNLHDCTKFKPPCHINEVDNPAFLEYLTQSKFWPTRIPVCAYERRSWATAGLLRFSVNFCCSAWDQCWSQRAP